MESFFTPVEDGLRLFIKVQPGASKNAIEEVICDPCGQAYLKVRVTAVPEKGKANIAVAGLLATSWKLPVSSISITARETSRLKTFHVKGNPEHLAAHLTAWFKQR